MQFTPQLLVALGLAFVVLVALVLLRARVARNRKSERAMSRGPANLRYVCAGCSEQFTHTRRTLGAWEKGTRRLFCNACHTKWRGSHPLQQGQGSAAAGPSAQPTAGRRAEPPSPSGTGFTSRLNVTAARASSGRGCLGVTVLLIAVPVAVAFIVLQYA
jgi:DNA-directed RNA polymerase subunit RPC12/RpoP